MYVQRSKTHIQQVRGCEVVVTVPNKSRSQVYQEWLSSFDQTDQRSVLFRRIRGGAMWNTLGTMVSGTYEARPVGGTSGEVGFKTKVYGRAVGEETIEDLKKDSFVKSSFLNNTNCCSYICSDANGPLLWTSEATFEDDDKASGVATKITLKLRFRPKGCIVLCDEEKGGNCPLWCLFPPVLLLAVPQLCLIFSCNNFEAGYSRQRAIVRGVVKFKYINFSSIMSIASPIYITKENHSNSNLTNIINHSNSTPEHTGTTKSECDQGWYV